MFSSVTQHFPLFPTDRLFLSCMHYNCMLRKPKENPRIEGATHLCLSCSAHPLVLILSSGLGVRMESRAILPHRALISLQQVYGTAHLLFVFAEQLNTGLFSQSFISGNKIHTTYMFLCRDFVLYFRIKFEPF